MFPGLVVFEVLSVAVVLVGFGGTLIYKCVFKKLGVLFGGEHLFYLLEIVGAYGFHELGALSGFKILGLVAVVASSFLGSFHHFAGCGYGF